MDHEQRPILTVPRRARSADSMLAHSRPAGRGRNSRAVQPPIDEIPPPAVPPEVLDDRIAIVGTAGSGKTYAAKGFVERLLDSGARVTIVDPLGVWWGLRASADGTAAGYPVIIFGGRHADVPIAAAMGSALGRIIAREALACVVDLSELGSSAAPPLYGAVFRGPLRKQRGTAPPRSRRSRSVGAAASDQRLGKPARPHRGNRPPRPSAPPSCIRMCFRKPTSSSP